jgi:hypothetical protein
MQPDSPASPPFPKFENAQVLGGRGGVWPDGWTSQVIELTCQSPQGLESVELVGWNPDWSAIYAGNVVTLDVDGTEATTVQLAMGERFRLKVDRKIAAGARFRVTIRSAAARVPDPLDARERAFVLNSLTALSQK